MCRTERYNIVFPDGHTEGRERLVNTCPRGTPSNPCRHHETVNLYGNHLATPQDIEEYRRRHAPIIEPTLQPETRSTRHPKAKGTVEGLSVGFKIWNPFSSKNKKKKERKKLLNRNTTRPSNQIAMVDRPPRAPSPPPAWLPRQSGPKIIERKPHDAHDNNKKHRKREPQKVVLHHHRDSSEDDDSSEPEQLRIHERRPRHRSQSPASRAKVEKQLRHEKEKRERAEKAAEAEREARVRAERDHQDEMRRERQRRQRIGTHSRYPLESAEGARRRQDQEDREDLSRAEMARRQQQREDIERIRRSDEIRGFRADQDRFDRLVPIQPRHPVALHNPAGDMQTRGNDFLNNAMHQAALRRENEGYPRRPHGGGLGRRETVHEDHRPRRSYERRRPDIGRQGGSG